jgi:hemoglobin-like flavoprotein
MIAALVGSLDEHPLFQSMVTNSGRTHARFGVQPSQYVAMGEALMWSLDCKFGYASDERWLSRVPSRPRTWPAKGGTRVL